MLRLLKELLRGPIRRDSKIIWSPKRPTKDLQTGDMWFETDHWGNENGHTYVWTKRKTWKEIKYEGDK